MLLLRAAWLRDFPGSESVAGSPSTDERLRGLQCVESPNGRVTSDLLYRPPNLGGQTPTGTTQDGDGVHGGLTCRCGRHDIQACIYLLGELHQRGAVIQLRNLDGMAGPLGWIVQSAHLLRLFAGKRKGPRCRKPFLYYL